MQLRILRGTFRDAVEFGYGSGHGSGSGSGDGLIPAEND